MNFRTKSISIRVAKSYKKLPVAIEAVQIEKEESVQTLEGKMTGNPGDWKVTGVDGEKYYVAKSIFKKTYEPNDAEAKEAWKKAYG